MVTSKKQKQKQTNKQTKKTQKITNVGEDVEKLGSLCIVGGNGKLYSHLEKSMVVP